MTIKPSRNPYGYRELLVYQKADAVQSHCATLTSLFPSHKTLYALSDQMNRSARSTKQNITEGWKRNSTKEYYEFLGYALASNAELEEDATDICKGYYRELMGVKGIMGEKGLTGERGDIEQIQFYPLDTSLPNVLQLKLKCKEINFLITQLQQSLVTKMNQEMTLPATERLRISEQIEKDFDNWLKKQKEGLN